MADLSPTSTSFDPAHDRPTTSHDTPHGSHHRHSHGSHGHASSHMHTPPPADGFRPATPSTPGGRSEGSSSAAAASHDEPLTVEAGPNAVCAGCKRAIEQDGTAGVVISFGSVLGRLAASLSSRA